MPCTLSKMALKTSSLSLVVFMVYATPFAEATRLAIHAKTSERINAILFPNSLTIGGKMPCSEYLRIVDLGQLVSFTASATCTKGEITSRLEFVVMVTVL